MSKQEKSIKIDPKLHQKLKVKAAEEGKTVKQVAEDAIKKSVN